MTAEEFLIEKRTLIKGAEKWPINLSRDCHVHTKNEIIKAMDEYAALKQKEINDMTEPFKSSWQPIKE